MSAPSERLTFHYRTDNLAQSVAGTRALLRKVGWAQTRIIEIRRAPTRTPGLEEVAITIEGYGQRGTNLGVTRPTKLWPDPFFWGKHATSMRPGSAVRTLDVGENWVGGRRHVMPAGASGTVVRAEGILVRVRFAQTPRHTFVYNPRALELLSPSETNR